MYHIRSATESVTFDLLRFSAYVGKATGDSADIGGPRGSPGSRIVPLQGRNEVA